MTSSTILTELAATLAFAGDLSMGQPTEHSPKTSLLAVYLAKHIGLSKQEQTIAARLGLLRWAGCTANAQIINNIFGDDIESRVQWLAGHSPFIDKNLDTNAALKKFPEVTHSHCDAMNAITQRVGITFGPLVNPNDDSSMPTAIADLFELWDGSGYPTGREGKDISQTAQIVTLVSDLEIFSRHYGMAQALEMLEARRDKHYSSTLLSAVLAFGEQWLDSIAHIDVLERSLQLVNLLPDQTFTLDTIAALLSDYAALKLPRYMHLAREASKLTELVGNTLGLSILSKSQMKRATLLHRLGVVGIPNHSLSAQGDNEYRRLAPYWTERILNKIPSLSTEAGLASMAYERLDGSGYHRGLSIKNLPIEARIIQATIKATELQLGNDRQWKQTLEQDALSKRLDKRVVDIIIDLHSTDGEKRASDARVIALTKREKEIMPLIAEGLANKEIARKLGIAPKTVGVHLENIYRKLGVSGRTAASIKALEYGLFEHNRNL